jgi:hypothetical protein
VHQVGDKNKLHGQENIKFQLPGLIGMASHPDMQKIPDKWICL